MSDPFIGEIRAFGFNFAPQGWMVCDGQVVNIADYTALFAVIGTTYGGDGVDTFAVPNLQGSVPIGTGQGPGLSSYDLGQVGGAASVTLLESEIPSHTHGVVASTTPTGAVMTPSATVGLGRPASGNIYGTSGTQVTMAPTALATMGGGNAHNNLQPYRVVRYCICFSGITPA